MQQSVKEISLLESGKIFEALALLEQSRKKIVLIIDAQKKLKGIVVDGDIRRALIKGLSLDEPVSAIMNSKPHVADSGIDRNEAISFMQKNSIQQLPLVNTKGQVVEVLEFQALSSPHQHDNWVVIMAGGEGRRLRPLTENVPKPMLKVGTRPILETIIRQFISHGFSKFILSVNYLADSIVDYFGDGEKFGVEIKYIREKEKMGTAGSLSLFEKVPSEPFIVMNGDILTNINFSKVMQDHNCHNAAATMCVREYKIEVPFGVVEVNDNEDKIIAMTEKPTSHHYINAGIYVLDPAVLLKIPENEFFDMTDLFSVLIEEKSALLPYVIHEYWADIGRFSDFEKVNNEYSTIFTI